MTGEENELTTTTGILVIKTIRHNITSGILAMFASCLFVFVALGRRTYDGTTPILLHLLARLKRG
jgi:hypothetical protein